MAGTTVRVSEETHAALRRLAHETHEPLPRVIARAVELYRRQRLLDETNAAFAALRADPQAWGVEQEERSAWEITLSDGLRDE